MPRYHVRLYIEDSGLPDGEAVGGDCSHILFDGPDNPEPDDPLNAPLHPAFGSPIAHTLIGAMGIDPSELNHTMVAWDHGDGTIGLRRDSPRGHIHLSENHGAINDDRTYRGVISDGSAIIEFSSEHMLISLMPGLAWYASGETPEGFFFTNLLSVTQAVGITDGTPLSRMIDIPALAGLDPIISRIDAKADGIHEIRVEATR